MGYHRAGFTDIVGVDCAPQPRYPFAFVQADALEYLAEHGHEFDAIHASPPCQRYSCTRAIHNSGDNHPDLVAETRRLLEVNGKPWVIENVMGAPLHFAATLCGLMFGLDVIRHRLFESSVLLMTPDHPPHPKDRRTGTHSASSKTRGNGYSTGAFGLVCVAGNNFVREAGAKAMGIDWMGTRRELANAIPPAYTEFVGKQLFRSLEVTP